MRINAIYLDGTKKTGKPKNKLKNLQNIKELHFQWSWSHHYLPPNIIQCVNLEKLKCSFYKCIEIPPYINTFTKLTYFDCSQNGITNIPLSLFECVNLTFLNIGVNKITEISDNIGYLTNLRTLICDRNNLTYLPGSLTNCFNLTTLRLECNHISNFNVIYTLQNLTYLNISCNKDILNANIQNCYKLKTLICQLCDFVFLPNEIGNLINLEKLDCSYNYLQLLPDTIGNLINLIEFYCNNNYILSLPESIGNLQKLKTLDVKNNRLLTLPLSIINLKHISYLIIKDEINGFKCIEIELNKDQQKFIKKLENNKKPINRFIKSLFGQNQ